MPGFERFGKEEIKHVQDVLETGILMRYNFEAARNGIWKTQEFEQAIQRTTGAKYAHLVSSGTTALITAIKSLGIEPGDEIILPTFTFVASFEAVLFTGAVPVLVDIDDTLTLSPKAVEKAITSKTKAIMPVHMCGAMADLDPLLEIAHQHNLFLIEDACQAIGGSYKGKYLGTLGDVGCFSFDFVKTVTCGEGGAILTNEKSYYEYCQQFSDHGHDHIGHDRGAEDHPIIGLNFRISELHAAVGLAQWEKLDEILSRQRTIKSYFKAKLAEIPFVSFRRIPDEAGDNASFLSIFLENEEQTRKVWEGLKKEGIPCAYWYDNNWHYIRKWHHFKNLKNQKGISEEQKNQLPNYAEQNFSASDEFMKRTLSFPLSLNLTEEKINQITALISSLV